VRIIFELGRMSVLRALLKVKTLMSKGERYILNNLYIDDYLCWYPPYMSVLVPPYMSVLVPPYMSCLCIHSRQVSVLC